jgi:hypothetical protein
MAASLACFLSLVVVSSGCSFGSSSDTSFSTDYHGTKAATWASLLRRPLHLPTATAGTCPTSPSVHPSQNFASAIGAGPLYPTVPEATLQVVPVKGTLLDGQAPHGTFVQKVLWFAPPSFEGRALVRGAEVGGPHRVWFSSGGRVSVRLWLSAAGGGSAPGGWRNWPTGTIVGSRAGCYAYQIDGPTFSRVIVFRVEPGPST